MDIDAGLNMREWAVLKLHADLPERVHQTLDHLIAQDGPSNPEALVSDATRILANEHLMLKRAEVFCWEPDIIDAVRESALGVPTDIPFSDQWLFTEAGFWYCGPQSSLWGLSTVGYPVNPILRRIHAITYMRRPADVIYEAYTLDHHEPTGGPVPIFGARWLTGVTMADQLKSLSLFAPDHPSEQDVEVFRRLWPLHDHVRDNADIECSLHKMLGRECPVHTPEELVAFNHDCYTMTAEAVTRFFLAANLWLQQKLLVGQPRVASRGARRRAERQQYNPAVKVITLRRTEHADRPTDERSGREFDCRWIVRGHWHHYWIGGVLTPKYLTPYVKGPEGKPLKVASETVFKVSR